MTGLTLPPGAVVAPPSDSANSIFAEQKAQALEDKSGAQAYQMGFNCEGTLESVAQHVEDCLRPQGYKRLRTIIVPGGMINSVARKVYFSPDHYTEVQVSDWTAQNAQSQDLAGKARFMITVVHAVPRDISGRAIKLEGGDNLLEDL